MANQPTIGVFVPSYLNACNSPGPTGQQDAYGNDFPTGLNPGKLIELGTNEAQELAAPGTSLYDGAYMWVQLDSGATAANAVQGLAAYIKLDTGSSQGVLPETAYQVPIVTTEDKAASTNLFAGVFLNPATLNGQANTPTPGNWIFIFVGAGRASVQYKSSVTDTTLGDAVNCAGGSGTFDAATTLSIKSVGKAVTAPANSALGVAYFNEIFYRLPN
jgi:hypothetical protein